MKVLAAKVSDPGKHGFENPPRLQILVDKIPPDSDLRYKKITHEDGTSSYFVELDGYVNFYWHNPKNEYGYASRVFHLPLEDGTTEAVRGPWSSREYVMEQTFGVASMSAEITDDPVAYEKGYTFMAGSITRELAETLLPFLAPKFGIGRVAAHGEFPIQVLYTNRPLVKKGGGV